MALSVAGKKMSNNCAGAITRRSDAARDACASTMHERQRTTGGSRRSAPCRAAPFASGMRKGHMSSCGGCSIAGRIS